MTLILQGTDNSVSSPAVQGGTAGTTTGVYYPASNKIALATNGTQAVIVNASQQVGINNATPQGALDVGGLNDGSSAGDLLVTTASGAAVVTVGRISGTSSDNTNFRVRNRVDQQAFFVNSGNRTAQVGLTFGVGNATPATTGSGITFPASQDPSSDANTLDDYEEGTWTPAFAFGGGTTGITYASQVGRYTRVGRIVTLQCYCNVSNKGSSSGAVTLTGFPFNSSSGSNNYCAVSIWGNSMTGLSGSQMAYIPPGQSFMYMYYSATGSVTAINNTNFGNNTDWMINVTYEVA